MSQQRLKEILKILKNAPKSYVPDASEPLDMLIFGILSARSPHKQYQKAFNNLKEYPWDEVAQFPVEKIQDLIKPLFQWAKKANRVKLALERTYQDFGAYSLKSLSERSEEEIIDYLIGFEGVGLKVASMVALYGFNLPWLPIDTHVERILKACSVLEENIKADPAHQEIREQNLPPDDLKELFLLLQEHGRKVCFAKNPQCEICQLQTLCQVTFGG